MSRAISIRPTQGVQDAIVIGGALVGLYLLYKVYSGWASIGRGVADVTLTPLANLYARLTMAGQMIPTGIILLPNGGTVAVAQLVVRPVPGTNSAAFNYGGTTYYLNTPHDENGNWAASARLA